MHDDPCPLVFELAHAAQRKALRRRRRPAAPARRVALPRQSPTQQRGADYEEQALRLLSAAGLVPLARNLRCRAGEIDLAMRDGATLVLVEVRARAGTRFGGAAASVGAAKQGRLARTAACLLPQLARRYWSGAEPPVRFDVVAFEADGPVWLRHAFAT